MPRTKQISVNPRSVTAEARLALAISEILNNPFAPARLRRDVGDFVTDISTLLLDDSPEMVEKALALGQCGYPQCPGTNDAFEPCPGPSAHPRKRGAANHVN